MSHILLEVVDANEEVSITCLQAVAMEKLLNELNIPDVCLFTLDLHTNSIVERGQESERLENPPEVFIDHALRSFASCLERLVTALETLSEVTLRATVMG